MLILLTVMTGLMAGIYFAFSVFVMQSLAQLPAHEGVRAMNAINAVIVKTMFLPLFFISSIAHLGLFIFVLMTETESTFLLGGAGAVYVLGMFFTTLLGNVPLNNRLAKYRDVSEKQTDVWNDYLQRWVRLNHIRTVSCTVSMVLMLVAISQPVVIFKGGNLLHGC